MKLYKIAIDVLCDIPSWVKDHADYVYRKTSYRIYIDNDLLTERTWDFGNNFYVNEIIHFNSSLNSTHVLKIVPVVKNISQAKFSLRNFILNNKEHTMYPNGLELTFSTT